MSWDERYKELEAFAKKHGHPNVALNTKGYERLAKWIVNQRNSYRAGNLNPNRKRMLIAIGLNFNPRREIIDRVWNKQFAELEAFVKKYGHFCVPTEHTTLNSWLYEQRAKLRAGTQKPDYARRLSELGVTAEPHPVHFTDEERWKQRYAELKTFKEENGHCLLSRPLVLGNWVSTQRDKLRKNVLTEERKQLLDSIGFVWNSIDAAWENWLAELIEYQKNHGEGSFPTKCSGALGLWVTRQRREKKRGKLSPERVERLEALGLNWNGKLRGFGDDGLIEGLQKFFRDNKHYAIPNAEPHQSLYRMVQERLAKIEKDSTLKHSLEKLGFPLDKESRAWERMFALAKSFHDRHGHCRFPEGSAIFQWARTQRQLMAQGELDLDKEERLSEIDLLQ